MERIEELIKKYEKLPRELKELNHWVCFNKTAIKLGEYEIAPKCPLNAITGRPARPNDKNTWTNFNTALKGCVKYGFDGLGFVLGDGIFGVDLDNHADENGHKPMGDSDFQELINEFVLKLDSYAERSQGGEGVHIICKGKLPDGARRKNGVGVEMYDEKHYFATTGDVVNDSPVMNREKEISELWEKYLKEDTTNMPQFVNAGYVKNDNGSVTFGDNITTSVSITHNLNMNEIIEKIRGSANGPAFIRLYNGDMSEYNNDHSAADMAMCMILAFWCGKDKTLMDQIFRSSALMREKWDRKQSGSTYGNITLEKAIENGANSYVPKATTTYTIKTVQANNIVSENNEDIMNIDANGDPVIKTISQNFKTYPLDDTGNAERFYDQFGGLFKYNSDNKHFMFWNGKTWIGDSQGYIRKYADVLIDVLKGEAETYAKSIKQAQENGSSEEEIKYMVTYYKEMRNNITRISNKAGKDAMLEELKHLHRIPASNYDFDQDENLLNTDSGIVDLTTGEIMPFNPNYMLSKNTNCKVSYEEPVVWKKFLNDIFERGNEEETKEVIDCVQMALGYSLTGRTNKEHLFILYGSGSNGKSTFIESVNSIFGDYAKTMSSDLLIQNSNSSSQSSEFALSALLGARLVSTSETAEGKKLDEVTIKKMLSGEKIAAQFKYGNPFSFKPSFSPWMSTNNKPIIRATDFGTWRRVFFIPFLNTFSGAKKDADMPKKIQKEWPQILGWMIQGNVRLLNEFNGTLSKPKCIEEALSEYKNEMDVIHSFLTSRCQDFPGYRTKASDLYKEYKEWCKDNNEYCYSESKFGIEFPKKGYKKMRKAEGFFYEGIKLNSDGRGKTFEDD